MTSHSGGGGGVWNHKDMQAQVFEIFGSLSPAFVTTFMPGTQSLFRVF
jgi:hypothetical protein